MHFADSDFNLTYALADPLLIGKTGTVNEPEWDAVLLMVKEDVDNLVKAKTALRGSAIRFSIQSRSDAIEFLKRCIPFFDVTGSKSESFYMIHVKPAVHSLSVHPIMTVPAASV